MKSKKAAILTLFVIVGSISLLHVNIEFGSGTLTRFTCYEELKQFLQLKPRYGLYYGQWTFQRDLTEGRMTLDSAKTQSNSLPDYSNTNTQVEGVDEADIVKTDNEHIYLISGEKVIIIKAYPAEEARILSEISLNTSVSQLFINGERLVIFYENRSKDYGQTFIAIYEISNKEAPTLRRTASADGEYYNSRMIGSHVYVITRKQARVIDDEVNLPQIRYEQENKTVPANEIYYSGIQDYGYVFSTIISVNVLEDEQAPTYKIILTGWATNMYVSMENIYLAICYYDKTFIHRIQIENGEIHDAITGEVPGTVLNQFSMDEHAGYFRIATTSQQSMIRQNNVYTLDSNLNVVGELENIAPGETIYSARFMGNIGYLVTFKKVDPFFVIDLSNPSMPKILGELKITGYSDYLHVYGEQHVIGIGKETAESDKGDFSWYQGVKITLFDVTDVTEPKELAKYEIGDRGTDSPVLRDHKAFLFNKEAELLVMPVSIVTIDGNKDPNVPLWTAGRLTWQGACVFAISLTANEKIVVRGMITHIENNVLDTSLHITRTLYIGEVLYTISANKIKMNSLVDLSQVNELSLIP